MRYEMTSGCFQIGVGSTENVKKFVFTSKTRVNSGKPEETLEIVIPELLQSGYSFYTWPCAPVLGWFLWERRHSLATKRVLEIGSGTSLPGILAAKCGAQVTLSDSCILPKSLVHIEKCCLANNLIPGQDIAIKGLSWGLLLNSVFNLGPLDLIIAADCFYDPSYFEDILVTISFLFDQNPGAKFIFSYQERSADWSIEALLKKWDLQANRINIDNIGSVSGINLHDLLGAMAGPIRSAYKLFVGNLPWTIGNKELQGHFSKFGHVFSASVVYDKSNGLSRNYAFVVFSTKDGYNSALNKSNQLLEGRILNVQPSNTSVN